ncbi:MAG: Lipid A export ATP-binding/permease protein MsbA [Alphaproteobacteria bacterium MarineAlpha3_Bin7]|nr:MAG: Lipid A export ATP-binding/permease protein MsbA [Alphaproteobacteria bacterium MarineAlpha3_Bin7]
MGYILEPKPNPLETDSADASSTQLVKRLFKESIRPYLKWIILSLICMTGVAAATATSAWLMKPVINEVFVAKNETLLFPISLAVILTFAIKGLSNYGQSVSISYVGQRIVTDTQHRLYEHLIEMELGFFHQSSTGSLLSRFTVDINMMRNAVSNALTGIGKDFLTLVFLVGVMFYQDWLLSLIAFFAFPIAIFPIVSLGKRIRAVTLDTQEEYGTFTTILEQTFQGARVVKAYNSEDYEKARVRQIAERLFGLVFKSMRIRSLASPLMETLGGLAVALVIFYGGYRVIGESMDPGSFFSFITALLLAYEPVKRLANLNATLQEGLAGAERLFALLDLKPGIKEHPNARELDIKNGEIQINNITFSYVDEQIVLNNISLNIPAGKLVALVGPSGSGKSTILNLIPRFFDVDTGNISIDGSDLREVTFASLRKRIGLVSQEIALFDDTIKANISYGQPTASEEKIIEAAKNALAHDFIMEMPKGYDTQVGEQGIKLSGGQRQRIAIARAMLKDAPILLLDEATSSLDAESENLIQQALFKLMKGRTTLVIAHRLSTIIDADLIYVVDSGKILESGDHNTLIKNGGPYSRLYSVQFGSQELSKLEILSKEMGQGSLDQ